MSQLVEPTGSTIAKYYFKIALRTQKKKGFKIELIKDRDFHYALKNLKKYANKIAVAK